jgi:hypothetical protein
MRWRAARKSARMTEGALSPFGDELLLHRLSYGRSSRVRQEEWATTASVRLRQYAIAISFSMSFAMSCR